MFKINNMSLNIINLRETNPNKYPTRMGEKWTEDEEIELITLIQEEKTLKFIAEKFQRTVSGVKYRLEELALKFLDKGYTMDQVQDMTRLKTSDIEEAKDQKNEKNKDKFSSGTSYRKQRLNDKSVLITLKTMKNQIDTLIEHLEDPFN
jgi:hypothetical protein